MIVKKKPIEYEAWVLNSQDTNKPEWVKQLLDDGLIQKKRVYWYIKTLEGKMKTTEGSILIRGHSPKEIWAVRKDIFYNTYDIIEK